MNDPESPMKTDWERIPNKKCKASWVEILRGNRPLMSGGGYCEGDTEQLDHVDVTLYNKHGRSD